MWIPVFLATNAERVCAEIMLNQKPGARMGIQPDPIALQSMIRKSMASGYDPMGGYWFSGKSMLKQKDRAR
jgi:hypothetical protein